MQNNMAKNQDFRLFSLALGVAAVAALWIACGVASLQAGDPPTLCEPNRSGLCDQKPVPPPPKPPEPKPEPTSDWSFEVGSGVLLSNVRTEHATDGYTLVPAFVMASLKLDEPEDIGCGLKGYPEFAFRGYGMAVPDGPESRIIGANVGPRYNFVIPNSCVVPFIGGVVGFGFADTRKDYYSDGREPRGLGQDFNFQFGANIGLRFDITERSFIRLMAEYVHFSNCGLNDHHNRPIDAFGPELSFGFRF